METGEMRGGRGRDEHGGGRQGTSDAVAMSGGAICSGMAAPARLRVGSLQRPAEK